MPTGFDRCDYIGVDMFLETADSQFEYNAYIRDFFADNKGKTLKDAIRCWKYKKSLKGHHQYERSDLAATEDDREKKGSII